MPTIAFPLPGSEFLPQGKAGWPQPPPNHSPWLPLPSHNQPLYTPNLVVQAYSNTTTHYDHGSAAYQMRPSLDTNAEHAVAQSQQLPLSSGTSDADVQPMPPPPNSRKRKARTLRDDDWEPVKARVIELHITQKLSLPDVKKMVEEEFKSIGFTATIRQYRTRVSQWGLDKNIKPDEMKAIVRKRQKRNLIETNKGELAFKVRGNVVEAEKIDRWMKRHDIPEDTVYAPSPAAATPSALSAHTISEHGSAAPSPTASMHAPASIRTSRAPSPDQRAGIPSPSPSLSKVFVPESSSFAGQSPALSYRSIAVPQSSGEQESSAKDQNLSVPMPQTVSTQNIFVPQDKPTTMEHSMSQTTEMIIDTTNTVLSKEIHPEEPLVINITDATIQYNHQEVEKIKLAADFLFAAGIWEDAFPLLVLVWKNMNRLQTPSFSRINTAVTCLRCIVSHEHAMVVRHLLEKELVDLNHASVPLVQGLLQFMLSRCCWVLDDIEASLKYFDQAAMLYESEKDLIIGLACLRPNHSMTDFVPVLRAASGALSYRFHSARAWGTAATELSYRFRSAKDQNTKMALCDHSISRLLLAPPLGIHDLIDKLWGFLDESLQRTLMATLREDLPRTEQVFCHLWRRWIEFRQLGACAGSTPHEFQRAAIQPLRPVSEGIEAVTIAELLAILASMVMAHDDLSEEHRRRQYLTTQGRDPTITLFIKHHHTVLSRHVPVFTAPDLHPQNFLRQVAQDTLNVVLPKISPTTSRVRSCVPEKLHDPALHAAMNSKSVAASLQTILARDNERSLEAPQNSDQVLRSDQSLAKSLHSSDSSSYRRFAECARSTWTQKSQKSSTKTPPPTRIMSQRSEKVHSQLTSIDTASLSFRALSIVDENAEPGGSTEDSIHGGNKNEQSHFSPALFAPHSLLSINHYTPPLTPQTCPTYGPPLPPPNPLTSLSPSPATSSLVMASATIRDSSGLRIKDTTKEPPLRILSLDDGGVRGYSMLIILQELMHRTFVELEGRAPRRHEIPKPCDHFDLIIGTGTGGLIALMLGRLKLSIDTCKDVYVRMTKRVFETDKTIGGIPYRSTLFKASKLEEAIKDCICEHTVHEAEGNDTAKDISPPDLPNTVTPRSSGSALGIPSRSMSVSSRYSQIGMTSGSFRPSYISRFGNPNALLYDTRERRTKTAVTAIYRGTRQGSPPALLRSYDSRKETAPEEKCTIWQAGRATCAFSVGFKPIQIGQSIFIDEGAGKYNPAPVALDEAVINEWPGREVGVFVSVGTGKRPTGPGSLQHLWWESFVSPAIGDFAECRRRLVTKIEGCEQTHQEMLHRILAERGVNPENYYRLNVEIGVGEFAINEWNRLAEISINTCLYLSQQRIQDINVGAATKLARILRQIQQWDRAIASGQVPDLSFPRNSWEYQSESKLEPMSVSGAIELPANDVSG